MHQAWKHSKDKLYSNFTNNFSKPESNTFMFSPKPRFTKFLMLLKALKPCYLITSLEFPPPTVTLIPPIVDYLKFV